MNLSFVKEKFVGIFEKGLLDELEKIGNYMELEEGHVIMRRRIYPYRTNCAEWFNQNPPPRR
jgi:CRP/FNR family transcriptional regulator